jgi:integrase
LLVSANKTGKRVEFSVASSPVLSALVERRKTYRADHLMLLSTPTGRQVSYSMLRDRWDDARAKAANKAREQGHESMAQQIEAMYLRDMRKRAADLAEDTDEASKLLQHSSKRLTEQHYRTKAEKVRPVR